MRKFLLLMFFVGVFFFCAGWVDRSVSIKSDPDNADVYFDDKLVGKTPLEFDFMWYAKHHIRLEKKGFQTLEATENFRAPKYMWIPLDLASELIPFYVFNDKRAFSYKLLPKESQESEENN